MIQCAIILIEVIKVATEKPRFSITVEDNMLKEIEDFRYVNRYPCRTQATIKLIRLGLDYLKVCSPELDNNSNGDKINRGVFNGNE